MSAYDDIFDAYVEDLRKAREEALIWWNDLLAGTAVDGDLLEAERLIRPRWPAGAVSHPRVIAVYRRYYLAIEALNEERPAPQPPSDENEDAGWGESDENDDNGPVEPRFILLDGLEAKDPELAEFMSRFVFCAIGSNPDDDAA